MSKDLLRAQERLARKIAGDGPIQKQIILLKLTDLLENVPDLSGTGALPVPSPQRSWVSVVGALLKRLEPISKGTKFDSSVNSIFQYREMATNNIKRYVVDAIEEIKLGLELEGRHQIGNAYAPGDYYNYFQDLKEIIAGAQQQIFVIDPYLNGEAFDDQ